MLMEVTFAKTSCGDLGEYPDGWGDEWVRVMNLDGTPAPDPVYPDDEVN